MSQLLLPDCIQALKNKSFYPEEPSRVRLSETENAYLFRTGAFVYKVQKPGTDYPTLAIKEAFCQEELRLLQNFNPDWELKLWSIVKNEDGYAFGDSKEDVVEYALRMEAMAERYVMSHLLEKHKVNPVAIGRVARRLAAVHTTFPAEANEARWGQPDHLRTLCDDMLYQMKRYFDASLTQPIQDMIRRPLEKFLDEFKTLFARRIKKGRLVQGHGALLPEHIYVRGKEVCFFSPEGIHKKYAVLDAANDVATLSVELVRSGESELNEIFLKRYLSASRDRDLRKMLPVYQTFAATKQGVAVCEQREQHQGDAEQRAALGQLALDYFNLAVGFSREIPRK